ncbi:MAG TPA: hypothetical protein PK566_18190, partial [Pseudobacteroides sp.]|nr:hypothetical protein [Pseudobacteroides sp.]
LVSGCLRNSRPDVPEYAFKAFRDIYNMVDDDIDIPVLNNGSDVHDFAEINDRIKKLSGMLTLEDKITQISTSLGCEELIKISTVDSFFKRVIFILDGDARYKEILHKPKISEYLKEKYEPKNYNDRKHPENLCFFPDYFAPESFLYSIIYKITDDAAGNARFWRTLDSNEDTALYTADKIKNIFAFLPENFNNDNLKDIFKDVGKTEIWQFVQKSNIITYYYSDYRNVLELVKFIEEVKKAYTMALSLTISNRY